MSPKSLNSEDVIIAAADFMVMQKLQEVLECLKFSDAECHTHFAEMLQKTAAHHATLGKLKPKKG